MTREFFLTAAEVDASLEMPLPRLVTLAIDVATEHANSLDFGYARLISHGCSWVLSRFVADISRMPSVNRRYLVETWVESINRLFSERNFSIRDAETGEECVAVHTVWMAIDMKTRRPVNLLDVVDNEQRKVIEDRPFKGERNGRLVPIEGAPEAETAYTYAVSDIDVNRHVTTRRYIELGVNLWPLEQYLGNRVTRFEVAFKREALYGMQALAQRRGSDVTIKADGEVTTLMRLNFEPRTTN